MVPLFKLARDYYAEKLGRLETVILGLQQSFVVGIVHAMFNGKNL